MTDNNNDIIWKALEFLERNKITRSWEYWKLTPSDKKR